MSGFSGKSFRKVTSYSILSQCCNGVFFKCAVLMQGLNVVVKTSFSFLSKPLLVLSSTDVRFVYFVSVMIWDNSFSV